MQCIYFNDTNLKSQNKSLRELGIEEGSSLDFCVDGEITEVSCILQDKEVKFHRSERCLITLFSQDVTFVRPIGCDHLQALARNGIHYRKDQSILLTYQGIHLRDGYQICYYPLFRHSQKARVDVEVVDYIGVKDDIPQYSCCCNGKKWIHLLYGNGVKDIITVDDTLSGELLEDSISNAISVVSLEWINCRVYTRFPKKV